MKMEDLLSSQQCDEILENREWVFGEVPYHEACMRRAASLAVREFAERMARRLEHQQSTRQEGAELLRCAARDLDNNSEPLSQVTGERESLLLIETPGAHETAFRERSVAAQGGGNPHPSRCS